MGAVGIDCGRITITGHPWRQISERRLDNDEALEVEEKGEVIEDYPSDWPFPSVLLLRFTASGPLHAVLPTTVGALERVG